MELDAIYKELRTDAQGSIEITTGELRQIRTGKASPALVEDLEIVAYEGQSKLKLREMATITTDGATTILIEPFDPATIQDIEKGIQSSSLHLNPVVQEKYLRISTPPLTEEQRTQFVKLANQKVEEGKIALRQSRDSARKKVKTQFDNKNITEDDRYRAEKEIDTITKKFTDDLDNLKEKKQSEIMTI